MSNVLVRIEIDPSASIPEVTIKCAEVNSEVVGLQKLIAESNAQGSQISFYKDEAEYFFPINKILFFETEDGVIRAHTATEEFEVKYKLYELEEKLPAYFIRISKSTILNAHKVYSLTKNLTGASKVEFQGTYKIVYCSRNYYKSLKDSLAPH